MRTQTAALEATKADLAIRKASEDRFMLECTSITAEKGTYFSCGLIFLLLVAGKLQSQIENLRSMQASADTVAFAERQKLESKLLAEQQESSKFKNIFEAEKKHLYNSVSNTAMFPIQNELTEIDFTK